MAESHELAKSWVLGVGSSSRMKAWEAPDRRGSNASFLWVSEGRPWEDGSTTHGPLNPGLSFLLSCPGGGGSWVEWWLLDWGQIAGPTWTGNVEVGQG